MLVGVSIRNICQHKINQNLQQLRKINLSKMVAKTNKSWCTDTISIQFKNKMWLVVLIFSFSILQIILFNYVMLRLWGIPYSVFNGISCKKLYKAPRSRIFHNSWCLESYVSWSFLERYFYSFSSVNLTFSPSFPDRPPTSPLDSLTLNFRNKGLIYTLSSSLWKGTIWIKLYPDGKMKEA